MIPPGDAEGVKWVEAFVTYDQIEAEIIKDILESGDIPVVLRSSKVGPYPVNVGKMGEVKLLVMERDLDMTLRIIAEDNRCPAFPDTQS